MALIKCPDCGRDVSTIAKACPNCGRPMNINKDGSVVTIQKTSKKIKAQGCIGGFMALVGFMLVSIGPEVSPETSVAGLLLLIIGMIMLIWSRIAKWWNHD